MNLEKQKLLVSYLISSPDLYWKVSSIINPKYFDQKLTNSVKFIQGYYEKYKTNPNVQQVFAETDLKLEPNDSINKQEISYAEKEVESFCRNKAIEHAILASPKLLEEQNFSAIEKLIKNAIQISLQKDLGLDYFLDPETRLRLLELNNPMIPTKLIELDEALGGGLNRKELLILIAGCVHPDTNISVSYKENGIFTNRIVKISSVKELLLNDNITELAVKSPDGFVKINSYINKGEYEEYILLLSNGRFVRVNENHVFQTIDGWKTTKVLYESGFDQMYLFQDNSYTLGTIIKTGNVIPIVDINVEHEHSRYYTNGIVSHNSGVGKSLNMANFAKNYLEQGLNVIYITLELDENVVGKRFDSMFTGYAQTDILKNITKISSELQNKKDKHGKMFIKRMPASTTNANHIRAYLKEFELINGIIPDVIVIDYLDLMASVEKISVENVSIKDKYVAEEIRTIAQDYDCIMISASQLNRGGADSSAQDLSQSNIAGGFTKIFTADNVVAIQQTDQMKSAGEYLYKLLKTRSSSGVGKIFMVNVDPVSLLITNKQDKIPFSLPKSNNQQIQPKEKSKPINQILKHFNI